MVGIAQKVEYKAHIVRAGRIASGGNFVLEPRGGRVDRDARKTADGGGGCLRLVASTLR